MNLGMAVRARATEHSLAGFETGKCRVTVPHRAHVTGAVVAVLAKVRHVLDQQLAVLTSVRIMASETIFLDGRMFPDKRTALVGVALIAKLVDVIGLEITVAQGSMRIMTIGAGHFPFYDRVM